MQHRRPVRSTAALSVAALALLAFAGCGGEDTDEPDAARPAASSSPTESAPEKDGSAENEPAGDLPADAPKVKLLDAGSDPQAPLRLQLDEGQVERTTLTMTTTTSVDGQTMGEIPMQMDLVSTVKSVSDEEIVVVAGYENPKVDVPQGAGEATEMLEALEDISLTQRIAPNGATIDSKIDYPDDAPEGMSTMFVQIGSQVASFAVPFPAEPVGEGAKWEFGSEITLNGIEVAQVATYTLTSFDGDSYAIDVAMDQEFLPGTTSGIEIVGGTNTGTGSFEGSLQGLMATTGSTTVDGSLTMKGGDQEITTETSATVDISTTVE